LLKYNFSQQIITSNQQYNLDCVKSSGKFQLTIRSRNYFELLFKWPCFPELIHARQCLSKATAAKVDSMTLTVQWSTAYEAVDSDQLSVSPASLNYLPPPSSSSSSLARVYIQMASI